MSLLQTFHLSHLPPSLAIHVALFQDLKNASYLREQLVQGNAEFEYAFIDASSILSTTQVLAAAFRAINDYSRERLKSRNVHSEIVFSLSPNNNKIADSFRKFGITDSTRDLLVVKVSTAPDITHDSVAQHLGSVIDGTAFAFTDESLKQVSDVDKIAKMYKLGRPLSVSNQASKRSQVSGGSSGDAGSTTETEDGVRRGQLEKCIIGSIALRGAT